MLFLSTALYIEAQPFIKRLSLKQNHTHTRYQIFENENTVLIITGTGQLRSCAAITYLCMSYPVSASDLFINFGVCGSFTADILIGSAFLIHKLTHYTTLHSLYPDILLKLPFSEASLITYDTVVTNLPCKDSYDITLADMEGYAVFFAAQQYFLCHQMLFIKVVSDQIGQTNPLKLTKEDLLTMVSLPCDTLIKTLTHLSPEFDFFPDTCYQLSAENELLLKETAKLLHLSETMTHEMSQYFTYYSMSHDDLSEKVNSFLTETGCITLKREAKLYAKQLKQRLLGS